MRAGVFRVNDIDLIPPKCMAPGGDRLQHNGTHFFCVCVELWSGRNCDIPPSPPPSPPPPPHYAPFVALSGVPPYDAHSDFVRVWFNTFVADAYTTPVYGHREDHTEIAILPVPTASTFDDVAADDFVVQDYITRSEYNRLSTYAGQWHLMNGRRCQATCAGSRTQVDVQGPAGPLWSCDSDDLLCQDNTQNELQTILDAIKNSGQVHANCPKTDPCLVVPPPCYYVSTECIPQAVLDYTLNNTSTRVKEEGVDYEYLHEPLKKDDITQVKLVSGRWPLGNGLRWPYDRGLEMTPVTGRDGNAYYKTCTYSLTQSGTSGGMTYGFALADPENNHVYDSGHRFGVEMWQRTYGETASPALTSTCTDREAGNWKNRVVYDTPNLMSQTYVFGSCAQQCTAVLGLVPHQEIVAPFKLSTGVLRERLTEARAAGKSAAEQNLVTSEVLEQRARSSAVLGFAESGSVMEGSPGVREGSINPSDSTRHASVGEVDRRFKGGASFAVPHVLASVSVLALIGLVARYDAIINYARSVRERRTEDGLAERAALLAV